MSPGLINSITRASPVVKQFRARRPYSIKGKLSEVNAAVNRVGREGSDESKRVLKLVRGAGLLTALVAVGSIMWTSQYAETKVEENINIPDLGKDVRSNN
ncbi:Piso0_000192 [Millerozyma farinosa CBS 7064]|uniref:Piso0_000192 protein n=1 Tax=Pichia sorbitophila (strain ATCC MYA-4447 / BCRC 22081 / CBS 7064 / NBRC 10061 / NRRL Y-12695) TaxID=559304 RepID=G8YUS2_PICSO|nr:Piso0_000192 [Millerozyma farinosa CBS 7064]